MAFDKLDHRGVGGAAAVTERGLPIGEGVGRQVDYWMTAYKRTWKGSVISSFVTPIFYVLAMGVLLGGFIEGDPDRLEGATSYLAFVVPGLVAAHAMQTAVAETTFPVMGMIKWNRTYHSMLVTPLAVRDVVTAHLLFVLFRLATTCGVFMVALVPFGVFATWWGAVLAWGAQLLVGMAFACLVYAFTARLESEQGFGVLFRLATTCGVFMVALVPFGVFATWWGAVLAWGAQLLVGMAFGCLVYAFTARLESEQGFGVLFRLGIFPLFLFSGAFFPIANLGPVLEWAARLTPLWHGVNLSRMLTLDTVDWSLAAVHVVVLAALVVLGWRWSVVGLARRLIR
jgi:lipooligosaccharide transport system permease protein